jgi:L-rhamnose isomerase
MFLFLKILPRKKEFLLDPCLYDPCLYNILVVQKWSKESLTSSNLGQ